jgi:hypothetical protein
MILGFICMFLYTALFAYRCCDLLDVEIIYIVVTLLGSCILDTCMPVECSLKDLANHKTVRIEKTKSLLFV